MAARPSNSRRLALVVRGDGTDAARLMAEHFERIKASRWAAGVRWPEPAEADPYVSRTRERSSSAGKFPAKEDVCNALQRPEPADRARHARLVRHAVTLNPWLTTEQANMVAEAWAKMVRSPDARASASRDRKRRRKGKRGRVKVRYECPACGGPHSRADHRETA